MTDFNRETYDFRILILAPTQKDSEITADILQMENISCTICPTIQAFCVEFAAGAGAGIITEEALAADHRLSGLLGDRTDDLPLVETGPETTGYTRRIF